jgi:hypothetical protein
MPVSKSLIQVTWDTGSLTNSLSAGSSENSDAFSFSSTSFEAMITCKCDNASTPQSGDTTDFWLLFTTGDPDGAEVSDEYDSDDHGMFLCNLDTSDDDPALCTVRIPVAAKGGKIRATNNSGGRSTTISCQIYEAKA